MVFPAAYTAPPPLAPPPTPSCSPPSPTVFNSQILDSISPHLELAHLLPHESKLRSRLDGVPAPANDRVVETALASTLFLLIFFFFVFSYFPQPRFILILFFSYFPQPRFFCFSFCLVFYLPTSQSLTLFISISAFVSIVLQVCALWPRALGHLGTWALGHL